jgi:Predicted nucleotidyltransferases
MPVKKVTIEEIKAVVEPIARKYGVERVYLFSSYARGDMTENSDVDLRVDKESLLKGYLLYVGCIRKLRKLYR